MDPQLMQLGVWAERYLHEDPITAIFKLRQFAERASKTIAARHAVYLGEYETFEGRLRRLSLERIIPKQIADLFHGLRKMGNRAVHDESGSHADALTALKFAWQLGVWFHRTYHKDLNFKPAPFVAPPEPTSSIDDSAPTDTALAAIETELKAQLDELNRRLVETEGAANRAKLEAEDQARARETLEDALKREAEERKIWEELAHQAEKSASEARRLPPREAIQERLSVSARHSADYANAPAPFDLAQAREIAHLQSLQAAAEQSPKSELAELAHIGEQAASKIDLDEAATRELIDQQLRDSGWEADTKALRYANGARPIKNENLAIAEWPTANGPADYALFTGLTFVGVIEAKRKRKNVSAAVDQAERYSVGIVEKPQAGETIQDPAAGTAGFLVAADRYIKDHTDELYKLPEQKAFFQRHNAFVGAELVPDTHRLCMMNLLLHGIDGGVELADTLSPDGERLAKADLLLTNPPFGTKKGGGRPTRSDFSVTADTSNKQLAFVEHIVRALKPGGRAAVVVPDNVLFEDNTGRRLRTWLIELCNLHTILRLPTGIFYAQGVKTNVLFFQRGKTDKANTKAVWVYDMRANMPAFGKTRPLTVADFADFENAYSNDPNGGSKRKDQGEEGRWRTFTREQIAARNDNLDISWLRDTEAEAEEHLTEPEDIAAAIIGHLKAALEEVEALSEEIEPDSVEEAVAEAAE